MGTLPPYNVCYLIQNLWNINLWLYPVTKTIVSVTLGSEWRKKPLHLHLLLRSCNRCLHENATPGQAKEGTNKGMITAVVYTLFSNKRNKPSSHHPADGYCTNCPLNGSFSRRGIRHYIHTPSTGDTGGCK